MGLMIYIECFLNDEHFEDRPVSSSRLSKTAELSKQIDVKSAVLHNSGGL